MRTYEKQENLEYFERILDKENFAAKEQAHYHRDVKTYADFRHNLKLTEPVFMPFSELGVLGPGLNSILENHEPIVMRRLQPWT